MIHRNGFVLAALQLLLLGGQLEVVSAATAVKSQAQLDAEIKARLAC